MVKCVVAALCVQDIESILHQGGFRESSGSVSPHLEDELNDMLGRR